MLYITFYIMKLALCGICSILNDGLAIENSVHVSNLRPGISSLRCRGTIYSFYLSHATVHATWCNVSTCACGFAIIDAGKLSNVAALFPP